MNSKDPLPPWLHAWGEAPKVVIKVRASRFATLKLIEETHFAPDPADSDDEDDEDDEDE